MSIEPPPSLPKLSLDPILLSATIRGTQEGLRMCNLCPEAVGATCFFTPRSAVSVIVGMVGKSSGSLTLNLTESGLLHLVGGLLGEKMEAVTEEVIDGIMEIGNMIAGSVKAQLEDTNHEITNISLPSVIFGHGYQVLYSRGINTAGVEFEITEMPFSFLNDRFFSSTVSLLPATGQ